ncbi:MAG: oligosaccharide flippase family protein [Prevotella sp.]|nr:oligosaccharide flippase family protein [Prevotella sp.]
MKSTYKDILKAITLFGGVHGLNLALNIIRTKLAAMLLGPAGVGLNSIYNETRELMHTSTNVGMDKSGVTEIAAAYGRREEPGGEERLEQAVMLTRSWVAIFVVAGVVLTLLLAPLLSRATFNDSDHTWGYMLLSPAVGLSSLVCGELVVLTGLHRLKELATVSVMQVIVGILTTIPLYYVWGMDAVVPALVLMFTVQALVVIGFSYRQYRPRFCFSPAFLKTGGRMLRLGITFVLAGVVAHATQLAIQAYLNKAGSLETVGLYSSASALSTTVAGVILASLSNDYFPRLAGVFSNYEERLRTVRSQIEVCVPLCLPISVALIIFMPIIVPLLLSGKFLMMVPMAQIIMASLIYRGMHQPLAYMALSAGDSKLFFVIETASCVLLLPMVTLGYSLYGLDGIGVALFMSNFLDLFFVAACTRWRYNVLPSRKQFMQLFIYTAVVIVTYLTTRLTGMTYWICGIVLIVLTSLMSVSKVKGMLKKDE